MIQKRKSRRQNASGVVLLTTSILLSVVAPTMAETDTNLVTASARSAIQNHPSVVGLRAEVCSAVGQIDQAKSRLYPKLDLRLNGGSSLSSKIERPEIQRRRFDDKDIDAVFSVNQTLYDWGITTSSVGIASNTRASSSIGLIIESERIAADIIGIMIDETNLSSQDKLFQDYRDRLAKIAERIEAGVEAGAHRLTDLRRIKINQLDAEVAHQQIKRQLDISSADLLERVRLSFDEARPLYAEYLQVRPLLVPVIESKDAREVQRLDLSHKSNLLELKRTQAERKPSISATLDTTLFDVDSFSSEYEVVGRVQLSFPLYDGGSNKARQSEQRWRGRAIEQERLNLIRNHRTQSDTLVQRIDQLTQNLGKVTDKISEVDQQLEANLARQGQTESQPLETANLFTQLHQLHIEQLTLNKDIELERLRGIFFADQLSEVLNLSYGASSC